MLKIMLRKDEMARPDFIELDDMIRKGNFLKIVILISHSKYMLSFEKFGHVFYNVVSSFGSQKTILIDIDVNGFTL